jgi:hypothetical protein
MRTRHAAGASVLLPFENVCVASVDRTPKVSGRGVAVIEDTVQASQEGGGRRGPVDADGGERMIGGAFPVVVATERSGLLELGGGEISLKLCKPAMRRGPTGLNGPSEGITVAGDRKGAPFSWQDGAVGRGQEEWMGYLSPPRYWAAVWGRLVLSQAVTVSSMGCRPSSAKT